MRDLLVAKPLSTARRGKWHLVDSTRRRVDTSSPAGEQLLPMSHCSVQLVPGKAGGTHPNGPVPLHPKHKDTLCLKCLSSQEAAVDEYFDELADRS